MFIEAQFPAKISDGASVQLFRAITNIQLRSGFEKHQNVWAYSLRRFNIASGIQTFDELVTTLNFWYRTYGPRHGFRWKDVTDYKSTSSMLEKVTPTDQIIGTGDGSTTTFQLRKAYESNTDTYHRDIKKPVEGTVKVAVNAQEVDAAVSLITGTVVIPAPTQNAVVTAGYEYDVPVRFEKESLDMNVSHFEGGDIPDIDLVELVQEPVEEDLDNVADILQTFGIEFVDSSVAVDLSVNVNWGLTWT